MISTSDYYKDCAIYPGQYTLKSAFGPAVTDEVDYESAMCVMPGYKMQEFPDHFLIDLPLTNISRDNIRVFVHDQVITVKILQRKSDPSSMFHRSFDMRFKSKIDTGFISATYLNGLLKIYIPKTVNESGISSQEVAVY